MKYSLSLMTFSIRDLFWLTALVALAVGWWVEREYFRSAYDADLKFVVQWAQQVREDWQTERRDIDSQRKLWQFRAEELAESVRKDGYKVTWAGEWNDHTTDIVPPQALPNSQAPAPNPPKP